MAGSIRRSATGEGPALMSAGPALRPTGEPAARPYSDAHRLPSRGVALPRPQAPAPSDAGTSIGASRRKRRSILQQVTGVAWVAGVLLFLVVAAALAAPILAPQSPYQQELTQRLMPPAWMPNGSWEHPLGADDLGRDILSRLLYGSR